MAKRWKALHKNKKANLLREVIENSIYFKISWKDWFAKPVELNVYRLEFLENNKEKHVKD